MNSHHNLHNLLLLSTHLFFIAIIIFIKYMHTTYNIEVNYGQDGGSPGFNSLPYRADLSRKLDIATSE